MTARSANWRTGAIAQPDVRIPAKPAMSIGLSISLPLSVVESIQLFSVTR